MTGKTTAATDAVNAGELRISDDDLATLRRAVPEKGRHLEADTLAFWRELPRLLAEGQEGRETRRPVPLHRQVGVPREPGGTARPVARGQ